MIFVCNIERLFLNIFLCLTISVITYLVIFEFKYIYCGIFQFIIGTFERMVFISTCAFINLRSWWYHFKIIENSTEDIFSFNQYCNL